MSKPIAAHTHPWKISDVVIFPLLGLGLVLEWIWPTAFGLPRWIGIAFGLAIVALGFALIQWSKRTLDAHNQPSLPETPTTELITTGPFGYSRNPNYLGSGIALLGGAVAFDSVWLLGTAAISLLILDRWMIRPEERYLGQVFGDEYEAYCRRTRRWI